MNENYLETRPSSNAPSGEENNQPSASAQTARKPLSPAKLAANRRNGQKSKGPKTEEGKSRSRWNALKHGVLSQRLVVLKDDDSQTYTLLLENLRRDLSSDNALEEILIEKIAMAYWRLHVAYGYEAEFARSRREFLVVADRMGRYANTIHRQLLAAMNELERLQRRRLGETVPAPIAVDVNVNEPNENLADELHARDANLNSLASFSVPASVRLIGTGISETAGGTLLSNGECKQFCETNPREGGKPSGLRSTSGSGRRHLTLVHCAGPVTCERVRSSCFLQSLFSSTQLFHKRTKKLYSSFTKL